VWLLWCCYGVARVFWVVVMVLLGSCYDDLGGCYGVLVVARVLLGSC